ncbi:unnamed protein product [Amaranthus hypochondriacus]
MKELFIVSFQKLGPAYIRTVRELVKETLFLIFQLLQNEKYEGTLHSLNWQHTRCNTPKPEPIFNTLFEDHKCGQSRPMAMNNSMMNTAPESRPRNSPCCFS